jgi:sugar lactone lactonase YvrE
MEQCAVLRFAGGALERYASLRPYHEWHSNDMLVTKAGYAYVGSIGFDYYNGAPAKASPLVAIAPDGTTAVAARDLLCPNGMVVTSDGSTLVVAESLAGRLTAFELGDAGTLTGRRTFADLGPLVPDGICRDERDQVLFASIGQHSVVRVTGDGFGTVATSPGREVIACALGGPTGRTLFLCTSVSMTPGATTRNRDGRVERVELPE